MIHSSNKKIIVLPPQVVLKGSCKRFTKPEQALKEVQDIVHNSKITSVVYNSAITALSELGYQPVSITDNNKTYPETISLLTDSLEKDVKVYIQEHHIDRDFGPKDDAMNLNENFGKNVVKLGNYFNADLILGIRYGSLFYIKQSVNATEMIFSGLLGVDKSEKYSCYIVLIDAKTGNVVYSDVLHDDRGFAAEENLLKPNYHQQIDKLLKLVIPPANEITKN
ncbi:MAG: hypothetical protein P8P83_04230 [Rickettsiaceae bacterium]|nr:hypothetical protein [Rickettsiaceae bacterium]